MSSDSVKSRGQRFLADDCKKHGFVFIDAVDAIPRLQRLFFTDFLKTAFLRHPADHFHRLPFCLRRVQKRHIFFRIRHDLISLRPADISPAIILQTVCFLPVFRFFRSRFPRGYDILFCIYFMHFNLPLSHFDEKIAVVVFHYLLIFSFFYLIVNVSRAKHRYFFNYTLLCQQN